MLLKFIFDLVQLRSTDIKADWLPGLGHRKLSQAVKHCKLLNENGLLLV